MLDRELVLARRGSARLRRLLEIVDEGILERARTARPDERPSASVASTRPASISEILSQRAASFMKCVETKMVTP
jgi:hypothetical protein